MKIGYARVSTEDQRLDLQLSALHLAGCEHIFQDHGVSGRQMRRPGLHNAMKALRPGQTLVVWRLDRLGRSLIGLVQLIEDLGKRGIEFQSLTEAINTSSNGGRLVFHIMAALAEFERSLISERTRAGMTEARLRGNRVGRPPVMSVEAAQEAASLLYYNKMTFKDVAARFSVSERTLQRHLAALD